MLRVSDYAKRTDTGRRRTGNEDSLFVRSPLFVIADGMGGAQAGEVASQTAIGVFADGLPDGPGSEEERMAVLAVEANARIHALAASDEQMTGMGTTLTAAYLGPEDLAVVHVGDSRMYRFRDGELSQITDDHSLVGELVRRGQLTPEEAEDHPQRSIITRALGPEGQVVVDHHTWPVRDGDVFLLCSDGLTDMVPDEGVAEVLRGAASLSDASHGLVQAANDAGGRDNITVVLFRVEEVAPASAGETTVGLPAAVAPDEEADQATMAGASALRVEDVQQALAVAEPPAAAAEPPVLQPRSPRPPREPAPASRRRRWSGPAKALLVVAILLSFVASGAWIASRSVSFVATDDDGFVTLYTGLPYDVAGLRGSRRSSCRARTSRAACAAPTRSPTSRSPTGRSSWGSAWRATCCCA
jgi:serine/threonine protein phosphatase PrpC